MNIYRDEDLKLCRNLPVIAFWSDGGFSYQARGVIHKLDSRSVTVKLLVGPGNRGKYARSPLLTLPRFADQTTWSSSCCVRICKEAPRSRD